MQKVIRDESPLSTFERDSRFYTRRETIRDGQFRIWREQLVEPIHAQQKVWTEVWIAFAIALGRADSSAAYQCFLEAWKQLRVMQTVWMMWKTTAEEWYRTEALPFNTDYPKYQFRTIHPDFDSNEVGDADWALRWIEDLPAANKHHASPTLDDGPVAIPGQIARRYELRLEELGRMFEGRNDVWLILMAKALTDEHPEVVLPNEQLPSVLRTGDEAVISLLLGVMVLPTKPLVDFFFQSAGTNHTRYIINTLELVSQNKALWKQLRSEPMVGPPLDLTPGIPLGKPKYNDDTLTLQIGSWRWTIKRRKKNLQLVLLLALESAGWPSTLIPVAIPDKSQYTAETRLKKIQQAVASFNKQVGREKPACPIILIASPSAEKVRWDWRPQAQSEATYRK